MPAEHFPPKVGPEFRSQIDESIVRHTGSKMNEHRATGSASWRVIQIREASAHRTTEKVVPIERATIRRCSNDSCPTDCVPEAGPKAVTFALAKVARIFMESRRNQEVTEEILGRDIGRRGPYSLSKRASMRAVLGIGMSGLGKSCIEEGTRGTYDTECFIYEQIPMFSKRTQRGRQDLGLFSWRLFRRFAVLSAC